MGQSLSEPKTEKETVDYDSGDYMVAVSGMQGWRPGSALLCQASSAGCLTACIACMYVL